MIRVLNPGIEHAVPYRQSVGANLTLHDTLKIAGGLDIDARAGGWFAGVGGGMTGRIRGSFRGSSWLLQHGMRSGFERWSAI